MYLGIGVHKRYAQVAVVENHTVGFSDPGTDIDGDGNREHSNVHVGELQWGTVPTNSSGVETPDPTVRIEVDYHEDSFDSLDSAEW